MEIDRNRPDERAVFYWLSLPNDLIVIQIMHFFLLNSLMLLIMFL